MQTTLNKIRAQGPCGLDPRKLPATGFQKLRNYLGRDFDPDKLFSLRVVFESNGFDDAVWCLRAVEGKEKEIRLLAVAFARQVQHLMTDPRSIKVLDVAEAFAHGLATAKKLKTAAAYAAAAYAADAAAAAYAAVDVAADAYAAARAKQTEILLSFLEA